MMGNLNRDKQTIHIQGFLGRSDKLVEQKYISLPLLTEKQESYLMAEQFSSVAQLCLALCNPMDYSMPGIPVLHQLLELTQTHVHRVCDAIKPFHFSAFFIVQLSHSCMTIGKTIALTRWTFVSKVISLIFIFIF